MLSLEIIQLLPIVFEIFSSSEFFHHYHLVLTHLWCDFEKSIFLIILSKVKNACPTLLVLSLKVLKKFVERLISRCQLFDWRIERFSLFSLVTLNKVLKLFDFLNSSRAGQIRIILTPSLIFTLEEKHLRFLILVLLWVILIRIVHA